MRIVEYLPKYRKHFEQLNKAWVERYFSIEPMDEVLLHNPEDTILKKGGRIFFIEHQTQIIGTVALLFVSTGVYELAKMTVKEDFRGLGAGKLLCKTAIDEAKKLNADKLILFTNSKLKTAIAVYHKLGFKEVSLDGQEYSRADTKMELLLKSNTNMESYLNSTVKQFMYYKILGEKAMEQLQEEQLYWQYNEESNSIAMLVNHITGNMLSRFTDFLTSDGEKPWRNRDAEFLNPFNSKAALMHQWDQGWECLFKTLMQLTEADMERIIYIRNDGHTVVEAINRQLAHYPYHIGQIIFIAKMIKNENWQTLSIARNKSNDYNSRKFSQDKERRHFTDDL